MAMTRTRKIILSVAASGMLAGAGAVALQPLVRGERVDDVASIAATREYRDTLLLEKAWALPVARLYRPAFEYQRNVSFCGPASLVAMMRSLGLQADQPTVLAGTGVATWLGYLPRGLTLDQLGDVARARVGGRVSVLRDLSREEFRAHLRRANDPGRRYLINFSRGPLFGRGGGHHSPIAGYLADEDLVLVADVNAKYQPWLVSSDRLYDAMKTADRATGRTRGLLLVEAGGDRTVTTFGPDARP